MTRFEVDNLIIAVVYERGSNCRLLLKVVVCSQGQMTYVRASQRFFLIYGVAVVVEKSTHFQMTLFFFILRHSSGVGFRCWTTLGVRNGLSRKYGILMERALSFADAARFSFKWGWF